MKIKGRQIEPLKPTTVVLPRGDGEPLVFKVQPVVDYEDFEKVCPYPKPPVVTRPGGKPTPDEDAPEFKTARFEWYNKRTGWTYLKSFAATEGLEWETMTLSDPNSWGHDKFVAELKAGGFTTLEIGYLIRACDRANMLDEKHMEEVRNRFLLQEAKSQG